MKVLWGASNGHGFCITVYILYYGNFRKLANNQNTVNKKK